jgi:molybdopterin/thiamine biosynthesis adenylyltransferase
MDADVVDASNLQRQIIHKDKGIGLAKVQSAREAILALNPYVTVRPYQRRFDADTAAVLQDYDLVLDGSDNFDTRYLVNKMAAQAGIPLISAAITQWEGQISLYDPAHGMPCYECRAGPRAHLCRGGGGCPLARRDRRYDGDGGCEAHHPSRPNPARAFVDP